MVKIILYSSNIIIILVTLVGLIKTMVMSTQLQRSFIIKSILDFTRKDEQSLEDGMPSDGQMEGQDIK